MCVYVVGGGVSECGPSSRDRWGTGDVGMEVRAAAVKIWLDVPAILRPVSVSFVYGSLSLRLFPLQIM